MCRTLIMVAMLLLACTEAGAQQTRKPVVIYGYGQSSCGAWLEARRGQTDPAYVGMGHWVLGFITAYNWHRPDGGDVLHGSDIHGALAWIDQYCRNDSTANLATAMARLIRHLEAR
jgi:hypothetical protein